jgi:hypothetical protein
VTEDYELDNNNNVNPGSHPKPDGDKVYISCVQTDALGLDVWMELGHGAIFYTWKRTHNFL